ncbi:hypothetical protein, partial [Vibrio vulnificus]|uniref:hypothetical protein n=1 Tax=Vibrio vulnificus TaxID=672 RepID=UPI004057F84F
LIEMNTTHIELPLVQNNVQIIVQLAILSKKSILCYNALLRCEQRNTDAAAYHLKHQTQRIVKMPRVANHS